MPYAIDFMNPAPDADLHSVGQDNFDWIVERGRRARGQARRSSRRPAATYRWDTFLDDGDPERRDR